MKSSKEQEEAIKYFENKIKDVKPEYIETYVDGKLIRSETISLKMRFDKEDADKMQTVLSMLKEKDEEIEKLKKDFKIVDEECSRLERKEAKQDKIIEVMTLFMSNLDIDEEICKYQVQAFCDNEPEGVTLDVCAKCIKQYFEKLVKEKGE